MKKVLITGSEGYIGSIMVPMLINSGYDVTGLDICYYSEANIVNSPLPRYKLIQKDIRDVEKKDLSNDNYFAVIHLAGLSNDPLGMLDDNLTHEINHLASVRLAEISKETGVQRFIFSSSCSLYGQGDGLALTEKSQSNPQTAYGKAKILAEKDISKLADKTFSPVFLRNATAFGFSPRMRFDIVVNSLTGFAKTENEIKILGDGKPWRPLVHIRDISGVVIQTLKSEVDIIHNQALNVGDNSENYQVKQIAKKIRKYYPDCKVTIAKKDAGDTRDYNVSFDKLNKVLGFRCSWTLEDGIEELKTEYDNVMLDKETFEHRYYTRLKQVEHLIQNNIIDKSLRRM